jgi:hypothetical protein
LLPFHDFVLAPTCEQLRRSAMSNIVEARSRTAIKASGSYPTKAFRFPPNGLIVDAGDWHQHLNTMPQ